MKSEKRLKVEILKEVIQAIEPCVYSSDPHRQVAAKLIEGELAEGKVSGPVVVIERVKDGGNSFLWWQKPLGRFLNFMATVVLVILIVIGVLIFKPVQDIMENFFLEIYDIYKNQ